MVPGSGDEDSGTSVEPAPQRGQIVFAATAFENGQREDATAVDESQRRGEAAIGDLVADQEFGNDGDAEARACGFQHGDQVVEAAGPTSRSGTGGCAKPLLPGLRPRVGGKARYGGKLRVGSQVACLAAGAHRTDSFWRDLDDGDVRGPRGGSAHDQRIDSSGAQVFESAVGAQSETDSGLAPLEALQARHHPVGEEASRSGQVDFARSGADDSRAGVGKQGERRRRSFGKFAARIGGT